DMVIVGGMNVYPREVEEVLYQHDAVAEAAVIGVEDDLRGEVPKAVITLKEGHEVSERDIIKYCREYLANYKVPRQVEFRDSLPKSATGKILKRVLRDQESEAGASA
ncbi:MAG: long-chain fatty acid--CoA ligase, partial [Halanaerobium sp.]|nr:long-chain fatty acid--CoA ligase [Halanaerobium sp.]